MGAAPRGLLLPTLSRAAPTPGARTTLYRSDSHRRAYDFGSTEQREEFILLLPPIIVRASAGRLVMLYYAGALAMVLLSINLNTCVLLRY